LARAAQLCACGQAGGVIDAKFNFLIILLSFFALVGERDVRSAWRSICPRTAQSFFDEIGARPAPAHAVRRKALAELVALGLVNSRQLFGGACAPCCILPLIAETRHVAVPAAAAHRAVSGWNAVRDAGR